MQNISIGDTVKFLNTTGGGTVKGFQNKNVVIVEDEHGFDFPVLITECIVINSSDNKKLSEEFSEENYDDSQDLSFDTSQVLDNKVDQEYTETIEGEEITSCLVYLPTNEKSLSTTAFECFFVNDSNYYLFINYMSFDNNSGWHSRYSGLVEPQTKLFLEEFDKSHLNEIEQICIQYVAFKHNKAYMFKTPVDVKLKIDPVKFYKLHSFKENDYFDDNAIVYYITKKDMPQRELFLTKEEIEETIKQKETPVGRSRIQKIDKKKKGDPLEVDLHIDKLLDSTSGMSNQEILNYQIGKFEEIIEQNKRFKGKKIIFIHGKGDGVLKQEILKLLKNKYNKYYYQDASFQQYGYGATMITIK